MTPVLVSADDPFPPRHSGLALPVDKPKGISSFGVVRSVRHAFGVKKVGHAGTLDPMATGLLIVLVGREATREQDRFMRLPKVYTGTIRLGESTPSLDAETDVFERRDASTIEERDLQRVREAFLGDIEQVPPMFSAIKQEGRRLYKMARRGETVEREARTVRITELEWTLLRRGEETTDVSFRLACSKGTYVRALARDVGEQLSVGGHLVALRREAIGPFHVDDAWSLDALTQKASSRYETGT